VVEAASAADLLIHDSTFDESQRSLADEKSHATAADAARAAKEAGAKQLLLFHISGRYHDSAPLLAEAKAIFPNTLMAEDGMKIAL
jgi:ribonuclease Z